jgi:hypothetical protein
MDDKHDIIGLTELLDEVGRDLDEFRKKHQSDYSVKTISLWWDMEKDRLLSRHSPACVVKKLRRVQGLRRTMIWFFAGWVTMLTMNLIIRLLLR